MRDLASVANEALPDLGEAVERCRHDLGKYVVFQLRSALPEVLPVDGAPWQDLSDVELREALQADLGATRRSADVTISAVQLWCDLRRPLAGDVSLPSGRRVDLCQDEDLREVDQAMAIVAGLLPRLPSCARADLDVAASAAWRIYEALRRLRERVRLVAVDNDTF
jgi:hypothetical protein